jgi:hypothetical protein
MPVVDGERPGPFFKHREFTYDAERGVYVCPQGTLLRPWGADYARQVRTYQAPARACDACSVRARCTTRCTNSSLGRALRRHFDEDVRERVRAYHGIEAYKRAMSKREVWVEPLVGEAEDWHGVRWFRLRGRENVNIEGLRIAAGQNKKRRASGRERPGPAPGTHGIAHGPADFRGLPRPRSRLAPAQPTLLHQPGPIVSHCMVDFRHALVPKLPATW